MRTPSWPWLAKLMQVRKVRDQSPGRFWRPRGEDRLRTPVGSLAAGVSAFSIHPNHPLRSPHATRTVGAVRRAPLSPLVPHADLARSPGHQRCRLGGRHGHGAQGGTRIGLSLPWQVPVLGGRGQRGDCGRRVSNPSRTRSSPLGLLHSPGLPSATHSRRRGAARRPLSGRWTHTTARLAQGSESLIRVVCCYERLTARVATERRDSVHCGS